MAQMSALIAFSPDTTILSADTNLNNNTIRNTYNAHDIATTAVHGVGAGAIVGTTLSQTLTNKTLTSPTITGPTFTGNLTVNSGGDILVYSDVATTIKFSVDGATGNTVVKGDISITGSSTITGNNDVYNGNDFRAYSDAGSTLQFSVDGSNGALSCGNVTCDDITATGSVIITGNCDVYNGNDFRSYSDAGSTLKFSVDGSTGNITGNDLTLTGDITADGFSFASANNEISTTGSSAGLIIGTEISGVNASTGGLAGIYFNITGTLPYAFSFVSTMLNAGSAGTYYQRLPVYISGSTKYIHLFNA
ncbi:MAG: hypothetical protein SFW66_08885 [Gammaproteobacteria bacterium]|nr:hypothetical protein [Gammaproteobacteria bacterium]